MAWPFDTPEYSFPRPRGIDTPMNYQDPIRSLPGGNYQNWTDLIAPISPLGFFTGKRRLHPNNPLLKLTQGLGSIFQPNEQMEAAISDIRDTGEFEGQRYNIDEDRNKIYSEVNPFGKNLRSAFGSNDPAEMDEKTLSWALDRLSRGKAISQRLRNILTNRGLLNVEGIDRPGQTIDKTIITDIVNPGQPEGQGYTGPTTYDFNPSQFARAGGRRADRPGGFTDPGKGSYGPWKAEGGRIGYRNGEFVDEDVNIQGPGFDVNENVMMASAPDPMAELEAFSLEIFKKPFDQLNDNERDILFELMNDQAAAGQGEGIASLV
jgi:hypothetical protein